MNIMPIFIVTGTPGSGKTTVSQRLMQQFEFGVHIPVDDLREWVVSGIAHPVPTWTEETARQFLLARESAAQVALKYSQAGFAVAIDDVISADEVESIFEASMLPIKVHKVLLKPSLQETLRRNQHRANKDFDTTVLEPAIRSIYQNQQIADYSRKGWLVLDSSNDDISETIAQINNHFINDYPPNTANKLTS